MSNTTKTNPIKCKNCGEKVENIIHYSTSPEEGKMSNVEKAPCKNCGEENIISSEIKDRGPAEVDLLKPFEIVQYLRDLLNLHDLLKNPLDLEILKFIKMLKKAGWNDFYIHGFINMSGYGTKYESLQDINGNKVVDYPLPNRGEQKEWKKFKTRTK